ncbi:MAG: twin-arginine protein translocation system subunit TatC [Myxococcaceae bacterium]|nr:twin-arginine protein translocation system subunit TatC [Myxococcaceae bacterium]
MSERPEKLAEGTLISHLLELRDRLVKAFLAVLVLFVPAAIFRNDIFEVLVKPLLSQLPQGGSLIATGVMSPFITPFKLAFFFAVFVAMPIVLYQLWAFVAPGLYRKEKRFAVPLLVSSIVLFYVGTYFAYKFVFPLAFHFFATSAPEGVQMMPDINNYLDFALTMFFAFGLAFEVPVVVVLLTLTGLVSVEKLAEARGYVIIGICVVAAVITPPDPLSMTLMAVPMWLLYEGGVIFARILHRGRRKDDDAAGSGGGEAEA